MATQLAPNAIESTMTTTISPVEVPGELEEAARSDASSTASICAVDWGATVVEEGGRASVEGGSEVTAAGATAAVVVDGKTVVVVLAVETVVVGIAVVVDLAVVAAGLAVVVVRLTVVVVRLTVVLVVDLWHPGRPWPAGGLHVLPGWAVAGPTYTHPAIPIATATANVVPNAMNREPRDIFRI
jgi:hypothetical protein